MKPSSEDTQYFPAAMQLSEQQTRLVYVAGDAEEMSSLSLSLSGTLCNTAHYLHGGDLNRQTGAVFVRQTPRITSILKHRKDTKKNPQRGG